MKRFLLGLIMVGSFAIAAAPMANAQNAGTFCGHNYAFQATGAEPSTATFAAQTLPLNYVAMVGELKFAALGSAGAGNCTVSGEAILVDDDYETIMGGPQNCPGVTSLEGTVPCFDGTSVWISGGTGPGPNGSNTIEFADTFHAVVGVGNMANITLPFAFTVFTSHFATTLIGNSNIPTGGTGPGQTAGNPNPCPPGGVPVPPAENISGCGPNAPAVTNQAAVDANGVQPGTALGPVLAFTAQQQDNAQIPVPTVYGAAPYAGSAAVLCNGFGGNMTDLVAAGQATQADEATGAYGVTSGSLAVFANGLASGSLSFNQNDDVGNTTGLSNYDCDFQQVNHNAYPDGATNNQALIEDNQYANPFVMNAALTCRDADAGLPATPVGANEVNSAVVWGATNQNGYTIVTGVSTPALAGGAFLPPGSTTTCVSLQETPAPPKVTVVKPANPLTAIDGNTTTAAVAVTDTSEAACFITATMPTVTGAISKGAHPGQCTISLLPQAPFDGPPTSGASPISFGVEAFTGTLPYVNISCTCTSSTSEDGGVTANAKSTISFTSPNCALTAGTSQLFTCQN